MGSRGKTMAQPSGQTSEDSKIENSHKTQNAPDNNSFVLVRKNPQLSLYSRFGNSTVTEQASTSGTDARVASSTGDARLPEVVTQKRRGGSRSEPLSRNARIRASLPSWSDLPLNQQTEQRSVARKFELIDRVLSACIYNKDTLAGIHRISLSEKLPPGLDDNDSTLSIAKFRTVCKEATGGAINPRRFMDATNFLGATKFLTSPDSDAYFDHPLEELPNYLAGQYDIPYWKVVLTWLATRYRNQTGGYNFVRLIIYAVESITRSILEELQISSIKADANRAIVEGIECRLNAIFGLLDDVFPKTLQAWSSYTAWLGGMAKAPPATQGKLTAPEAAPPAKASEQEQDPSITGLILISTIITIPFIGLGWNASDHSVGGFDSNFWFLVAGALIQIIGVMVVVKQLWRGAAFDTAWLWVWLWLGVSGVSAVLSMVFYTTLPSEWSSFAGYLAAAAQSFLLVQLMFTSPK